MKRIHKLISIMIMSVLVVATVAGCSSASTQPAATEAAKTEAAATQAAATQAAAETTAAAKAEKKEIQDLLMVTGGQSGGWYALGAPLAEKIMAEVPDVRVTSIEGGSTGNPRSVNSGEAQIGMTWSSYYHDALNGINAYENDGPMENIEALCSIQINYIYVVTTADKNINTLEDLIGKKVAPGKMAGGGEYSFRKIWEAAGHTYEDIEKAGGEILYIDYSDAAPLLKEGQIDAYVQTGPANHNLLMDISTAKQVKVIPIPEEVMDKFCGMLDGFGKGEIPMGSFDGQTETIPTPICYTTVIVNKSMDAELAEKITQIIIENGDEWAQVHPDFAFISKENAMAGLVDSDLAAGAAKYLGK